MRAFLLLVVLLGACWFCHAQTSKTGPQMALHSSNQQEDTRRFDELMQLEKAHRYERKARAIAYAEKAKVIGEKLHDKKYLAKSYEALGLLLSDNKIATQYLEKAFAIYHAKKMEREAGNVQVVLAERYGAINNNKGALESYLKALSYFETSGDSKTTAGILTSISTIYLNIEDYSKALEYSLRALKLKETSGHRQITNELNNVGLSYTHLGKNAEALAIFFRLLKLCETEYKDDRWMAPTLGNIGRAYLNLTAEEMKQLGISTEKKNALAENYLVHSGDYAQQSNQLSAIIPNYLNLMRIYTSRKDFSAAFEIYDRAKYLIDSLHIEALVGTALLQKSEVFETMGRYDSAYSYFKKGFDKDQSFQKSQNRAEIRRKEMQFEYEKKEDSLRLVQHLTDEQLKKQTLLVFNQQQQLQLQKARYDITRKEKQLEHLAWLKAQADLEAELSLRKSSEKELTLAQQKKALQEGRAKLQEVELNLKENELRNKQLQRNFYIAGILMFAILFVVLYRQVKHRQRVREAIETERLKTEKAEAVRKMAEYEMQGLRAQLNPHFMFNSLNAIQEQILKEKNDTASSYLMRFARMLRMLLDHAENSFITIEQEKSFLELYLAMEKLRLPELQYDIIIEADIDTEKIIIPNMILQPYIENAIWHGLSTKVGEKKIVVSIAKKYDNIEIKIEDNGIGRKRAEALKGMHQREHKSKGMELLQKRFELIQTEYGSHISTRIMDIADSEDWPGTRVEITIQSSFPASAVHKLTESVSYN